MLEITRWEFFENTIRLPYVIHDSKIRTYNSIVEVGSRAWRMTCNFRDDFSFHNFIRPRLILTAEESGLTFLAHTEYKIPEILRIWIRKIFPIRLQFLFTSKFSSIFIFIFRRWE